MPEPAAESFENRAAGSSPPTARDVVCRRLAQQARRFPNLDLAPLGVEGLDDRDAALAHAIYDAALRRWVTLAWLLERRLTQPFAAIEPRLRGVLLAGATQLLFLDRVPPHAVIDHAVGFAKSHIRPGAGGLVNAVLRRIAELRGARRPSWSDARDELPLSDGGALALAEPILPEPALARWSIACSLHPAMLERWAGFNPPDAVRAFAWHTLASPPTILNVAHAQSPLPACLRPHTIPGSAVHAGSREELVAVLRARRDIWAQDPASAMPVTLARGRSPGLIIDVCAGQGTKTRQLAAEFPSARIVATDADADRLRVLRQVFEGSARVRVVPIGTLVLDWAGQADLVLLDVPCSNTGVLARRVEARHHADPAAIERLAGIQRQILADSLPLLAPRGAILYSTCSIEPAENQAQVAWIERWHGFTPAAGRAVSPEGAPGGPHDTYHDGAFAALLEPPRAGGGIPARARERG